MPQLPPHRRQPFPQLLAAVAAVVVVAGCAGAPSPAPSAAPAPTPTTTVPDAPVSSTAAGPSPTPRATRTASAVTLTTFAGSWSGHTRSLTVSASGNAHEVVYDGCCTQEIDMTFRLSNPHGTTTAARATATVTVTVTSVALYALPGPAPKVGRTGTADLVDGVLTVPFGGTTYCDKAAAARSECGA